MEPPLELGGDPFEFNGVVGFGGRRVACPPEMSCGEATGDDRQESECKPLSEETGHDGHGRHGRRGDGQSSGGR